MSKSKQPQDRPFVVLHIGDLHIAQLSSHSSAAWSRREARARSDFEAILADIDAIADKTTFDFVYLPGDLAENGCEQEYAFIDGLLKKHADLKVRVIPGDHDRARGVASLDAFEIFWKRLRTRQNRKWNMAGCVTDLIKDCPPPCKPGESDIRMFYFREDFGDVRCLFLDLVSAGFGQKGWGLDFRLGASQKCFLEKEIAAARAAKARCAIFMHCYPSDMHEADEVASVAGLIWNGGVKLVEMGHTHYNEVAHDGRTMYATARSVGQNEDGPVGFAVAVLDGDVQSWRFKQLQLPWPFVIITSPADKRLATEPLHFVGDKIEVRALVLTDQTGQTQCTCCVDDGIWQSMTPVHGVANMFTCHIEWPIGSRKLAVMVKDRDTCDKDRLDIDSIEPGGPVVRQGRFGSPDFQIGTYQVKGLRGDRLGPNNGGHKW